MALYGQETEKAITNFPITGVPFSRDVAYDIALVKKCAAEAHKELGTLETHIADAIVQASKELVDGMYDDQIVVDQIQGGAGTSMNMNVNEIIATRASALCGVSVHSLDHVNKSQSTNDAVPTAFKITLLKQLDKLIATYQNYHEESKCKSKEFEHVLKVGRTHLQDAVPITLGQEFGAHASAISHDIERLKHAKTALYELNIGGTAIGTGLNATKRFAEKIVTLLQKETGYPLALSSDLLYNTQYWDSIMEVSATLTILATNSIKFMNDLRLLASGPYAGIGEISFATAQKGSSIMPGKVNPVMAEMMNQIAFQVLGNHETIRMGVQASQLELNVMGPIIIKNLLESLHILAAGTTQFTVQGLRLITGNEKRCSDLLERSFALATVLCPILGYDKTAELVEKAQKENKTLKEIVIENQIMSEEEYNNLLRDPNLVRLKS